MELLEIMSWFLRALMRLIEGKLPNLSDSADPSRDIGYFICRDSMEDRLWSRYVCLVNPFAAEHFLKIVPF